MSGPSHGKLQKDRRAEEAIDKKEAEREARIARNQEMNQKIFRIGSVSQNSHSGSEQPEDNTNQRPPKAIGIEQGQGQAQKADG